MNPGDVRDKSVIGAIRGPVMMIIIGVLFAIDHGGGPGISRTWPAMLVVLGAMRLWEYLGARQA